MAAVAVKKNWALWARVKAAWLRSGKGGVAGKWNARKAMLATQEYKRRGGRYVGPRSPANSLKKWERESWGYVDGEDSQGESNPAGRYLPAAVRAALTPAEKRRENALKRGRAGERVPYSPSVRAKMGLRARPRGATKPRAPRHARAAVGAKNRPRLGKPAAKSRKSATKPRPRPQTSAVDAQNRPRLRRLAAKPRPRKPAVDAQNRPRLRRLAAKPRTPAAKARK